MKEVYDYIKSCGGVYYLATIDNNKPKLRPFGTLEIIENKLYLLTGKEKNVYKQLKKNNNMEVVASKGEDWIRISGELVEDDRKEIKKEMLDRNPHLRVAYNEDDDHTAIFYFNNCEAVVNSFTAPPRTIKF